MRAPSSGGDRAAACKLDPRRAIHAGKRRLDDLRRQHDLGQVLTVGLVGSSVWSERQQTCYGWDLVEVIRLLKDRPVAGVLIGGGTGDALLITATNIAANRNL